MSATADAARLERSSPLLLCLPALLLFIGIVLIPIVMTMILTFHDWGQYKGIMPIFSLKNWLEVIKDEYYHEMFLRTLRISVAVTLLSSFLACRKLIFFIEWIGAGGGIFLLIVLGPLLISVITRTLGWALLFGGETGLVNKASMQLGLIDAPIPFMFTEIGVVIALTHVLVPFMVLSVWTALQRLDPQVENAACSLGAPPTTILYRVIAPQAMSGILSGAIMVFSLAASAFATPAIIGGRRLKVASTLAYDEFLNTLNWPLGATVAILLLVALAVTIVGSNILVERRYAEALR